MSDQDSSEPASERVKLPYLVPLDPVSPPEWVTAAPHAATMQERARDQSDEAPIAPVVDDERLPDLPGDLLPAAFAAWVEAVATELQVANAMVVAMGLATIAACCQRPYFVRVRPGWSEPLGLYVFTVAEPGERKSGCVKRSIAPLQDWETTQAETAARAMFGFEAEKAALEALVKAAAKKVEGKPIRSSEDLERGAIGGLAAAERELAELDAKRPRAARILASDVTAERLAALMAENGGSISLVSGEALGPIAIAKGRYSDGPAFDVWLSGHAGDAIRVDRVTRPAISVRHPSMTLGLACQREALRQLGAAQGVRGLGVLARILYFLPPTKVGRRDVRATPAPRHVLDEWQRSLHRILDEDATERHALALTEEAQALLFEYAEDLEPRLGREGDLNSIRDWASKLVGTIARISALFAVFDAASRDALPLESVGQEQVRYALGLAPWLIRHAQAGLRIATGDPVRAVLDDPISVGLASLVPPGGELRATAGKLLEELGDPVANARAMASELRDKARLAALSEVGITITPPRPTGRIYHIRRSAESGGDIL